MIRGKLMIKFFLKKYAKCFGLILATGVVSLLLGNIISEVIGSADMVFLHTGFSVVKGLICSIAIIVVLYYYNSEERYVSKYDDNYFAERLRKNKKIRSVFVLLGLLPILAIGIACIVILIQMYPNFVGAYEYRYRSNRTPENTVSEMGEMFNMAYYMCRSLPALSVASIFIWIAESVLVLRRTCFGCGCYMSRIEESTSDFSSSDTVEQKTYDKKYEVGGIYKKGDDRKIASVYKTRQEQKTRNVHAWSWKTHSKCVFCGQKHEDWEADAVIDKWE